MTNNQLLKRLNGQFIDRASAYEAAQQALDSFNAYVLNGTPRTVSGIKAKDFNYKYFYDDFCVLEAAIEFLIRLYMIHTRIIHFLWTGYKGCCFLMYWSRSE